MDPNLSGFRIDGTIGLRPGEGRQDPKAVAEMRLTYAVERATGIKVGKLENMSKETFNEIMAFVKDHSEAWTSKGALEDFVAGGSLTGVSQEDQDNLRTFLKLAKAEKEYNAGSGSTATNPGGVVGEGLDAVPLSGGNGFSRVLKGIDTTQ